MNDLITSPTTPEAFIAYQENGINRKLDDLERKLADVVVGLVNGSYQEGIEGKENTVTIQLVRKFYKECNKELDEKFLRIWESICWWCDEAYRQGKEAAQ